MAHNRSPRRTPSPPSPSYLASEPFDDDSRLIVALRERLDASASVIHSLTEQVSKLADQHAQLSGAMQVSTNNIAYVSQHLAMTDDRVEGVRKDITTLRDELSGMQLKLTTAINEQFVKLTESVHGTRMDSEKKEEANLLRGNDRLWVAMFFIVNLTLSLIGLFWHH